jgi:hypothetical protein
MSLLGQKQTFLTGPTNVRLPPIAAERSDVCDFAKLKRILENEAGRLRQLKNSFDETSETTECRPKADLLLPEIQAVQITDQHLKAVYLRIAHQWSVLARSYEFADSAKHFLLDAKRTKDANSQQHSGELVYLPSSLASREAEHLLKHAQSTVPKRVGARSV